MIKLSLLKCLESQFNLSLKALASFIPTWFYILPSKAMKFIIHTFGAGVDALLLFNSSKCRIAL